MRVLHVLMQSVPDISGYTIRSQEILTAQQRLGIEVFALTSPYQRNVGAVKNGIEVIQGVPYFRTNLGGNRKEDGKRSWFYLAKKYALFHYFRKQIIKVCQSIKPDLIHGHSYFYSGYPASRAARKMELPFVYELRGLIQDSGVSRAKFKINSLQYRYIEYMERATVSSASKVVAISQPLVEYLLAQGWPQDKIVVVPNGVNTARFRPVPKDPELIKKHGLSSKVVIGFIGSFFVFEGLEFLLRGFRTVVSQEKNIVLFLVGTGETMDRMKRLAEELNLGDSVVFIGGVDYSDVLRYYSVMDICVYPRIKETVTDIVTPLKPLEAMAMGKAVLGSDVGGLRELIKDGQTGLLFKAGDLEDLVSKCLLLIRGAELRLRLGASAEAAMVRERDWTALAAKYVVLYDILAHQ